jgi:carbonic anhydrase
VIAAIEELSTDIELVIVHHTDCGMARLDGKLGEH